MDAVGEGLMQVVDAVAVVFDHRDDRHAPVQHRQLRAQRPRARARTENDSHSALLAADPAHALGNIAQHTFRIVRPGPGEVEDAECGHVGQVEAHQLCLANRDGLARSAAQQGCEQLALLAPAGLRDRPLSDQRECDREATHVSNDRRRTSVGSWRELRISVPSGMSPLITR